jgi:hypothetical protein
MDVTVVSLKSQRQSAEANHMATPDNLTNMNSRPQRVLLETGRYRIVGTLVLPRDGYRSRLSDFLNSSDRDFISLTDVSMQALDEHGRPGDPVEHPFVTVARQHVILATTTD